MRTFESIVLKENSGSHRKDEDKGIITHTLLSYDEYYILFISQLINMLSLYRYTTIK